MAKSKQFGKFKNQQLDATAQKQVKGGIVHYKDPFAAIVGNNTRDWNDIEVRLDDNPWSKKFSKMNSFIGKMFGR